MGRIWLGASLDTRLPHTGDARVGPDNRPAQPHARRPAPIRDDRPRWRNWFARR